MREGLDIQLSRSPTGKKNTENNIDETIYKRLHLYKASGNALDQERRWREHIAKLRSKEMRETVHAENRNIAELTNLFSDTINPWAQTGSHNKGWSSQSNGLMLAEWFLFKPPGFEMDYFFKQYPCGRHVTVVASQGVTRVFARSGFLVYTGDSSLPGGHRTESESSCRMRANYQRTVLDCVLLNPKMLLSASVSHHKTGRKKRKRSKKKVAVKSEDNVIVDQKFDCEMSPDASFPIETYDTTANTALGHSESEAVLTTESTSCQLQMQVLDLMYFRSTNYREEPFCIRRKWLEEYFKEDIERQPAESDDFYSEFNFTVIPSYDCEETTMNRVLSSPLTQELDGIVFYHGDASYTEGPTPLVGWLKPFMLPEWFPSVSIHSDYSKNIPPDYHASQYSIEHFSETEQLRRTAKVVRNAAEASPSIPSE